MYNVLDVWPCTSTLQTHKWVNAESMLEKCFIGPLKRNSVVKMKPSRSGMLKDHVYSCCTLSGFCSTELFIMTGTWLFVRSRCVLDHTAGLLKEASSGQKSGASLPHDLGWVPYKHCDNSSQTSFLSSYMYIGYPNRDHAGGGAGAGGL